MKIASIETVLFQPVWDDPFAPNFTRTMAAVTVRSESGLIGISRGTAEHAAAIHDIFAPLLLGQECASPERLWSLMERATIPLLGQEPFLISAIGVLDIALWDLFGHVTGKPCWQLLGGFRDHVTAYADIPIRSRTPEGLGEELAACVDSGYTAVKFHIMDHDPAHMIASARAARKAIGPDVRLMVDIFRALDPWTAVKVAREIEDLDIYWLEEPARWNDNPRGLEIVAQHTTVPVAGGESESSIFGARAIMERAGIAFIQTDTIGVGGFTPLRKVGSIAESFHVKLAPHGATFPELSAQIVAALPNGDLIPATTPHFPPAVWADVYEEFTISNGLVQLTNRPGLGLSFDSAYLRRHMVSSRTSTL